MTTPTNASNLDKRSGVNEMGKLFGKWLIRWIRRLNSVLIVAVGVLAVTTKSPEISTVLTAAVAGLIALIDVWLEGD